MNVGRNQIKILVIGFVAAPILMLFQNCGTSFNSAGSGEFQRTNLENAVPLECPGGIHSGSLVVSVNTVATGDCTIIGDLAVTSNATLQVNYADAVANKFIVRGNVTVDGSATLSIIGRSPDEDQFVIANDFSNHRSFSASGSGSIDFKQIEFRTQENINTANGSLYMTLTANDSAEIKIEGSKLSLSSAWLLAYLYNQSKLSIVDSQGLPTENYVHDSSGLKISGPSTETGLWLDAKGAAGILTLPNVNSPFSWTVGKNHGLDVGWLLEIENSKPGMGVEIREGTNLEIRGNGSSAPTTGELKIGYFVDEITESLTGLNAGIQNNVVSPRLRLVGVQLGPVAWQIYAGNNSVVNISNSKINEIGIYGQNARVNVSSSILQFAVLGAMAPSSKLDILNSEIWNQSIEADGNAEVTIRGSHIYGSLMHARASTSKISISNSAFHANPSGCTPATMVNVSTGQPQCNPFRAAGMPTKSGAGQVTCTNTSGCSF